MLGLVVFGLLREGNEGTAPAFALAGELLEGGSENVDGNLAEELCRSVLSLRRKVMR